MQRLFKNNLIYYLFIVAVAFYFQHEFIFEFPKHIHAWAQADRFALALSFLWNDFNILRVETFLMNLEFPNNFTIPKDNSVTMVNLPIHEYLIALVMKITGSTQPVIFRGYMLLWSFVALVSIKNIGQKLGLNKINQFLLLIFASTSPIFIYYQANFIPSIPSLAIALIGANFYVSYLKTNKSSQFNWMVLAFTISAIYRTTFIIPFIAICGVEFIRILKKESKLIPKIAPLLLMGVLFYLQRLHHLNQIHSEGSVFLYYLVPAENFSSFVDFVLLSIKNWKLDYLNLAQWIMLVSILIFGSFGIKKAIQTNQNINYILLFVFITFIGISLFLIAMTTKFPDHDYYYLDTLYIPLQILVSVYLLSIQNLNKKLPKPKLIGIGVVIIFAFSSVSLSKANFNYRLSDKYWDDSPQTVKNFRNSESILDSIGIEKKAKLLILGNNFPNLPLLLLNRKGFSIKENSRDLIKDALTWDYDYIVIQNNLYRDKYYSTYPELLDKVKIIFQNEKISILKLEDQIHPLSINEFLQGNLKEPIFTSNVNFEEPPSKEWTNYESSDGLIFEGNFSGIVKKENEFGLTFKSTKVPLWNSKSSTVAISLNSKNDSLQNELYSVVSLSINGKNVIYEQNNIINNSEEWKPFNQNIKFPEVNKSDKIELAFYLWNPNNNKVAIDNLSLKIY